MKCYRARLDYTSLSAALALGVFLGCGGESANAPTNAPGEVARIEIPTSPPTLVFAGEEFQLSARAFAADHTVLRDVPITWTSGDTGIVAVNSTGLVTARQNGQADVTAAAGEIRAQVTIRVDASLAATRCAGCHPAPAGHGPGRFPGATCPACHLPAFEHGLSGMHGVPLPGHATVARGFELLGGHDTLPCSACHGTGATVPPRPDCIACHEADYQRKHAGSGFPTTCPLCHTTAGFLGAVYPHAGDGVTFPLVGIHATFPCTRCHDATTGAPLFAPTSENDCVTCHLADYQGRHAGSGYPTTCTACHTPTQWLGAVFDHAAASGGRFTLVGTHLVRPCTVCHDATTGAPLFAPAGENDCVTCHRADYQRKHADSGFPTACILCHTPTIFGVVMFDHDADQFPIYIGTHAGRWTACATCHTVASNFSQFSCLGCHDQASTDADHRDRTGYRYESAACLGCHPRP